MIDSFALNIPWFEVSNGLFFCSDVPAAQADPKAAAGAGKQQRGGKATPKGPRGTSQGDTEVSHQTILAL